jgi:quercetin 2,3-dioxygenase
MVILRRAGERRHERGNKREAWLTFYARDLAGHALAAGFESLERLEEWRLGVGAGVPRRDHQEAEIITYVREGELAHEDSSGRLGVIHTGEFQLMTAGRGLRDSKTNASRTDGAHAFMMWFSPSEAELEPSYEQKRFSAAERRGRLLVVASPDARRGSLRIHQDALTYSALLDRGQHVVHELQKGRSAWVHVIEGEVAVGDLVLTTGDGVGVTAERAVSLTARQSTEILLFDLGDGPPPPPRSRRRPLRP